MSRKSSGIQGFLAKQSLFKTQKNKMHSSYITHDQYFKEQRVIHSQLNYLNVPPQSNSPLFLRQINQRSKLPQNQQRQSQIDPDRKLQKDITQQSREKQTDVILNSTQRNLREHQELEGQAFEAQELKQEIEKKEKDGQQHKDYIIDRDQEPRIAKTTSEHLFGSNIESPSHKFSSPEQDSNFQKIIVSPDPTAQKHKNQRQNSDRFAGKNSQFLNDENRPVRKNNKANPSVVNITIQNSTPSPNNSSTKRNYRYNYNQEYKVQPRRKDQFLKNNQNKYTLRNKYYDQILSEQHPYRMQRNFGREDFSLKNNFFTVTQRQAQNYVISIQLKLKTANLSLSNVQAQIDSLLFQNLEVQCQKIRNLLIRAIDNSLSKFRELEKRRLQNSKMQLIGELYQIQSNIEERRTDIQKLKFSFQKQNQWRNAVSQLLTHNFEENIEFLFNKTQEIQSQWPSITNRFLTSYNHLISQAVQKGIKHEMQNLVESIFRKFSITNVQKGSSPQRTYTTQNQMESISSRPLE